MDQWTGKVALVTGASAGIGKEIAIQLVNHGMEVVGVARRIEPLQEIAKQNSSKKGSFYPFQGDVSKEQDILDVFKWCKETLGPVRVLINNAGIAKIGPITKTVTESWTESFNTNVIAMAISTREAIKQMNENNTNGHIIQMNSIAGHRVLENSGPIYCASKHAVTAMTEAIRRELSKSGSKVKITSLSPGLVKTEMITNTYKTLPLEIIEATKKRPFMETTDIANAVLYILSTPPNVQISELTIQPLGEHL